MGWKWPWNVRRRLAPARCMEWFGDSDMECCFRNETCLCSCSCYMHARADGMGGGGVGWNKHAVRATGADKLRRRRI
ncbi:hypothetical protein T492DRAFT_1051043 [Pavlovales sp. CCMP2436]|nr:hypothetical protein T492DRAFT_1051043 [Pavlovales sp. CCMP2436]